MKSPRPKVLTQLIEGFLAEYSVKEFKKKVAEIDKIESDEYPNPEEYLPSTLLHTELNELGEVGTFLYLTHHTVPLERFIKLHYIRGKANKYCAGVMAINSSDFTHGQPQPAFNNTFYGCAMCPMKSLIEPLKAYYKEESYSWCPIFDFYYNEIDTEEVDYNCGYSRLIPDDMETLKRSLSIYVKYQELVIKNRCRDVRGHEVTLMRLINPLIEKMEKLKDEQK
jgi:hypothetical protein